MRFRYTLDDGDVFHVDTVEMNDMIAEVSDTTEAREILRRATDPH